MAVEPEPLTRAELGLRAGATVFWCCQVLFKYLPQFDAVFPRIARRRGTASSCSRRRSRAATSTDLFGERLERAFAAVGLDYRHYCVILPRSPARAVLGAIACCDVFLDSIGWSGCNSTLESLTADLPIVTVRGPLMRSRHSAAILEMMGVTETIASGVDDYVATAARLAREPALRTAMSRRIGANKHRLYRDRHSITALEDFLERVARRA